MIRRFGAVLIGLALILPVAVSSVAANHGSAVVVDPGFTWYANGANTVVVGTVTNNTTTRQANIVVTARFLDVADVQIASQAASADVRFLAPHSSSTFRISIVTPAGLDDVTVSVTASNTTTTQPVGGLHVVFTALNTTTLTATGTVTNRSTQAGGSVIVYGALMDGSSVADTAVSNTIASLAAGAAVAWTIQYDVDSAPAVPTQGLLVAQTTSGTVVLTSWNNYFKDIGSSSFIDEIRFLAEQQITIGCAVASFCPKGTVTREQMAIFLTRALGLTDFTDFGFGDIASRSQEAKNAINALANAGITGGCSADPKLYCPTANVTRGQMSKFIVTAYGIADATGTFVNSFTDDDGHFSESYNDAMKQAGITGGCGATTFCPNSNVTREQMAKFLFEAEAP